MGTFEQFVYDAQVEYRKAAAFNDTEFLGFERFLIKKAQKLDEDYENDRDDLHLEEGN